MSRYTFFAWWLPAALVAAVAWIFLTDQGRRGEPVLLIVPLLALAGLSDVLVRMRAHRGTPAGED